VWHVEPGFATFYCCRCSEKGYARDETAPEPDRARFDCIRQEATERERDATSPRLRKALWLWSQHKPIGGSLAERYLREARGYHAVLPATLGFLPARSRYPAAMIAAFELAVELEPGVIAIGESAIRGVHLTRLKPDGSAKAGTDADKIMIGFSAGFPIVLAPVNDLCGLAITEGIEEALSTSMATGLGLWAAGCGSRVPALTAAIPSCVEADAVCAYPDKAGQRGAYDLAAGLSKRAIEVRVSPRGDAP
jgi:hypothetical protein